MRDRRYYSVRTGKNPYSDQLDLKMLNRLIYTLYSDLDQKGYFQEAFGFECVDAGRVEGKLGSDIEGFMVRKLRKSGLWPIALKLKLDTYSEDDLFDILEFLYDYVSKPIETEGAYHRYSDCGWHYNEFNQEAGRRDFRNEINELLRDYGSGYELSEDGEILTLPEHGLVSLLEADIPASDPEKIEARINSAIHKFRSRHSSPEDRRDAIRDLADVLEFLRPKLKEVLTNKDEADLFNIANNFAIRHHNADQKSLYDKRIWYSWMFYFYLATIHAALRLIEKLAD